MKWKARDGVNPPVTSSLMTSLPHPSAAPFQQDEQVLRLLSSEKSASCGSETCQGARRGDLLEIEYTGKLEDGKVFDGSSIMVSCSRPRVEAPGRPMKWLSQSARWSAWLMMIRREITALRQNAAALYFPRSMSRAVNGPIYLLVCLFIYSCTYLFICSCMYVFIYSCSYLFVCLMYLFMYLLIY